MGLIYLPLILSRRLLPTKLYPPYQVPFEYLHFFRVCFEFPSDVRTFLGALILIKLYLGQLFVYGSVHR